MNSNNLDDIEIDTTDEVDFYYDDDFLDWDEEDDICDCDDCRPWRDTETFDDEWGV